METIVKHWVFYECYNVLIYWSLLIERRDLWCGLYWTDQVHYTRRRTPFKRSITFYIVLIPTLVLRLRLARYE